MADRRNPFFRFLRRLQADGRSNMYGAVPYLMSRFGLDRETAFAIVCEWLDQQAITAEAEVPRPQQRKRLRRGAPSAGCVPSAGDNVAVWPDNLAVA